MDDDSNELGKLLTTEEVAAILQVDQVTLKRWRMEGRGPRWVKLGESQNSLVRYSKNDVGDYIRMRTEGNGSP